MPPSTLKKNTISNIETDRNLAEIIEGLEKPQKTLPTKLFYDQYGSKLFDQICRLEEYYPTRTETAIMQKNILEMVKLIGSESLLIEFGSGSSDKTKILLDCLENLAAYIPVDISKDYLYQTADSLRRFYPDIEILPIWADYNDFSKLPEIQKNYTHPLAYFPGSTIGNFHPDEALVFLNNVAKLVGKEGGLLIGVDLQKDPSVLNLAYNDLRGVTAEFNLNILRHINNKYEVNFNLDQFEHYAIYNETEGRIEMHLISNIDQITLVAGREFYFKKGERILTEVSYKYSLSGFEALAEKAGFSVISIWTDENKYFSVQYLKVKS